MILEDSAFNKNPVNNVGSKVMRYEAIVISVHVESLATLWSHLVLVIVLSLF